MTIGTTVRSTHIFVCAPKVTWNNPQTWSTLSTAMQWKIFKYLNRSAWEPRLFQQRVVMWWKSNNPHVVKNCTWLWSRAVHDRSRSFCTIKVLWRTGKMLISGLAVGLINCQISFQCHLYREFYICYQPSWKLSRS